MSASKGKIHISHLLNHSTHAMEGDPFGASSLIITFTSALFPDWKEVCDGHLLNHV